LISPLTPSSGLVDQILRQCASGNAAKGEHVVAGVVKDRGGVGELEVEHGDDLVELAGHVGGVGLGVDGAHRGGDHVR
jgi:hypothetical protein